ncbi:hypothetical protein ACFQY9_17485 [Microvirga aerilata]|uniref:hypothetical protein n=1 Tax=Microvirga aerilata TaxID=670292 RepID=UPI00363F5EBE
MAGNSTSAFRLSAEAQNVPADRFRSAASPPSSANPCSASGASPETHGFLPHIPRDGLTR